MQTHLPKNLVEPTRTTAPFVRIDRLESKEENARIILAGPLRGSTAPSCRRLANEMDSEGFRGGTSG